MDHHSREVSGEGPVQDVLRQHQQALVVAPGKWDGSRRKGIREGRKEGGDDAGLVIGLEEGEEEAFEIK